MSLGLLIGFCTTFDCKASLSLFFPLVFDYLVKKYCTSMCKQNISFDLLQAEAILYTRNELIKN